MSDYDDSRVTLADGAIDVDGVKVSASRSFVRDPRIGHPTAADIARAYAQDVRSAIVDPTRPRQLWCNQCHEWKERAEFNNDRSRPTGKRYRCRICEQTNDNAAYRAEVGRPVAVYRPRRAS